jgi:hypothetical protein
MFSVSMPKAATSAALVETATKCGPGRRTCRAAGTRRAPTGVEHGFLGGEGLGGDDEQRGLGIDAGEHLFQVVAIDVGDEVGAQARCA